CPRRRELAPVPECFPVARLPRMLPGAAGSRAFTRHRSDRMRHRVFASVLAISIGLWACSSPSGNTSGSGGAGATTGAGTTSSSTTSGSGGGGGAGAGGGATSTSSSTSTSTGTGTGGGASFTGYTRVDSGTAAAMTGSADVAIAPGGAIYVSWVVEQNG